MGPIGRKFEKHCYKQSVCTISEGSNYSSGLSFVATNGGEKWMKYVAEFVRRAILPLLQEAVEKLCYAVCKHLL